LARPADNAAPKDPAAPRDIVLVVDDSPDTLGFLTQAIETTGATVLVALDGESALSLTEQITPDLVLMDAVMPGIGGFEACRRLKATEHLSQVPVIFMTGLTETEHIVSGLDAGGVDYLTKPIVVDELLARMRVHLRNARRSELAHSALDATGRYMLSVGTGGDIHWATPQAIRLLRSLGPAGGDAKAQLPGDVVAWLAERDNHPLVREVDGRHLEFARLGQLRDGEHLLRLTLIGPDDPIERLRRQFALTAREAEVLLWIARGKSNKDVSNVLHISPRTVNKHLEQVFEKLGVENRASATAVTIEALHRPE